MSRFFLILIFFCSVHTFGQNQELKGFVLYQNSGKLPVTGVEVSGQGSNPSITNQDGEFKLFYPNKTAGDPAKIIIGSTDKKGQYIELVNSEVINDEQIPSSTNQPTYIFVCNAGKLAEARKNYYKIGEGEVRKKYEKLKDEKKILLEKNNISEKEKYQLRIEIDSLYSKLKEALEKTDNLADYISRINKDFASEMVLDAIKQYEKGNVENALNILDSKRLDELYEIEMAKKANSDEKIKNIIEAYELKVKILMPQFRYEEMAQCFERLILMRDKNNLLTPFEAGKILVQYTVVLNKLERYEEALMYDKMMLEMMIKSFSDSSPEVSYYYDVVAVDCSHNEKYNEAIEYHKKAVRTADKQDESSNNYYNNYGKTLYKVKRYEEAIDKYKTAIELSNESSEDNDLYLIYFNIGTAYFELNNKEKALFYYEKSLPEMEKSHKFSGDFLILCLNLSRISSEEKDVINYLKMSAEAAEAMKDTNEVLVAIYSALARMYNSYGNSEQKKRYYQKAFDTTKLIVPKSQIDQISHYKNLADLSIKLEKINDCEHYHLMAIEMAKNNFGQLSKELANSYFSYCKSLEEMKKFNEALNLGLKAINIYETSKFDREQLDEIYMEIGYIHYDLKNYSKAINYFEIIKNSKTESIKNEVNNMLGLSYVKTNQFPQAKSFFTLFEKQNFSNERAIRNWAAYYSLKGEKIKALNMLEKAIKAGYKNIDWLTNDESMINLKKELRYTILIENLMSKKS